MPRIQRVVVPGMPHHVTQRGNRREDVFFEERDYETYLSLLAVAAASKEFIVWAYCLMRNHVHLIVCPRRQESLSAGLGELHAFYSRPINLKRGWRGHVWQGRYFSCVLGVDHLVAAIRYVENNPVREGLMRHAEDYR